MNCRWWRAEVVRHMWNGSEVLLRGLFIQRKLHQLRNGEPWPRHRMGELEVMGSNAHRWRPRTTSSAIPLVCLTEKGSNTPYKLTQGVHHRRCRLNLSGWMSLQVTMVRDREHPQSKQFLLTLKRYWLTNSFFGDAGSIRPGECHRVLGELHINWQHHVALCIGLDCKECFVKRWDLPLHRLHPLRTDASSSKNLS